jgi:hypothetical protein
MDSIVESLITQVATGDNLSALSKAVGGDQNAVKSAIGMGLPLIVGSMANKAAAPGGADVLMDMISKTGGSNPLDNLGGFLANPQGAIGATMVNSLLGSQMTGIQTAISQKTGLPPAIVGKVLAIATPIVMGYVSNMFMGKKMDKAGLTSMLGDQAKMAMKSSPDAANLAKQFLASPEVQSGIMASLKKIFKG